MRRIIYIGAIWIFCNVSFSMFAQQEFNGAQLKPQNEEEVLKRTRAFLNWYYWNHEEFRLKRTLIVVKQHESEGQLANYLDFLSRSGYFSERFMVAEKYFFEDECYQVLMHVVHEHTEHKTKDPCGIKKSALTNTPKTINLADEQYDYKILQSDDDRVVVEYPARTTITWIRDAETKQWLIESWPEFL